MCINRKWTPIVSFPPSDKNSISLHPFYRLQEDSRVWIIHSWMPFSGQSELWGWNKDITTHTHTVFPFLLIEEYRHFLFYIRALLTQEGFIFPPLLCRNKHRYFPLEEICSCDTGNNIQGVPSYRSPVAVSPRVKVLYLQECLFLILWK